VDKLTTWLIILLISFISGVGNILFKIGTDKFAPITLERLLKPSFALQYLFNPTVFAALVILFLGKFFTGSPLSTAGATETFVAITVLALVFTAVLETIVLHRTYDFWTYLGMIIGLISIVLIARMGP